MKQRQVDSVAILTPKGYLSGGDETDALELCPPLRPDEAVRGG
jgi:hypothetical protein